jgi:phenylpyruvate tautomerase PptA (4-oxalocrotonate tautomerase family)
VPPSQPYLNFLDLPVPENCLWGQLTDQEKTTVIETLTRLMAKATAAQPQPENEHD